MQRAAHSHQCPDLEGQGSCNSRKEESLTIGSFSSTFLRFRNITQFEVFYLLLFRNFSSFSFMLYDFSCPWWFSQVNKFSVFPKWVDIGLAWICFFFCINFTSGGLEIGRPTIYFNWTWRSKPHGCSIPQIRCNLGDKVTDFTFLSGQCYFFDEAAHWGKDSQPGQWLSGFDKVQPLTFLYAV